VPPWDLQQAPACVTWFAGPPATQAVEETRGMRAKRERRMVGNCIVMVVRK
jgi:hypothetical protein